RQEGSHDLRAVAVLVHAQHDEHRRHGRRRRQVSRPALRAARDQGRRRGPRALSVPDDLDRGPEARPARVRRDPRAHAPHRRRGPRVHRGASAHEARDVSGAPQRDGRRDGREHGHARRARAGTDVVKLAGVDGGLAPLVAGKLVQEVVAVAACVERLHPDVRFVSEIGGEDMKTIFLTPNPTGRSKQVFMQSACSGGTGTFIEKTARKLQVPGERLATMVYAGMSLHKVSSKCGIFAETDANTLVKTGVPVEEIIASLFEAVVYQNLATLTKGNTPLPGPAAAGVVGGDGAARAEGQGGRARARQRRR